MRRGTASAGGGGERRQKKRRRDGGAAVAAGGDDDDEPFAAAARVVDYGGGAAEDAAAAAERLLAADEPWSALAWLVAPLEVGRFLSLYWQRQPVVLQRGGRGGSGGGGGGRLDGLLSKAAIDALLRRKQLAYGTNVDVVTYDATAGRRTHNGDGPAAAADVWGLYKAGASVRVLHPQRWVPPLAALLSALERDFQCAVGANAYLTPPGRQARLHRRRAARPDEPSDAGGRACRQGFAPHWDDIDAFVLQLEGSTRWRRAPGIAAPR